MKFLAWLLSVFFAFQLGAETATAPEASDSELRDRVQEHIDVIVDEGAAIVDEITEEVRNDDRVKEAEQFLQDVTDVAEETLNELDQVYENTKNRVEEKFGPGEEAPAEEPLPEFVPENPEQPAPGEPVNG